MMKKIILIFSVLVYCSCNFSDEIQDLRGGWKFVSESRHDKSIDDGNVHVPCEVTQYGYNDNFIIAAQKPANDCFLGKDTSVYKEGRNKIYYWIVIKKQNRIIGPMNYSEYKDSLEKYKVPTDLKLQGVD